MLLRTDLEQKENSLSPFAMKSAESKGRMLPESPCEFRTEFQRDRDRIIHSKAFRRLMHKTQVFLATDKDHFRTRLTHTLEVSQIARTICRALNLNEDLAEAIALGHDLGHTPFGHNGESVLNQIHPGGFRHNEQSLRVVEILEGGDNRVGMNLTFEVRDGILNHTGSGNPKTMEGQVVQLSDRIAYINHDIDDAMRSGVITLKDLPKGPIELFGNRHSLRINNMVRNVVENSDGKDKISMDDEHHSNLLELRSFMFREVYRSPDVKKQESLDYVESLIKDLYGYYIEHPEELPGDILANMDRDCVNVVVKDYIAGMTDRYAQKTYERVFGVMPPDSF